MQITVDSKQTGDAIKYMCDLACKAAGLQVADLAVQLARAIKIEKPKKGKQHGKAE